MPRIKSKSIIVGIILYNPNIERLQNNLDTIISEADSILFIDNASKNIADIQVLAEKNSINLISNSENLGLPRVFNTMIKYANEHKYGNLLLLDQDSICERNLIGAYKEHVSENYVCLTPRIVHRLKEYEEKYGTKTFSAENDVVNESINSGTLINLNVLPSDVRFNEKLFVDCVDFDFFIQLKKKKLKILRVNSTSLFCDLGNLKVHYLFRKSFFTNNYSTFRLEKQARDRVVFIFTHITNGLAREVLCHSILGYLMILMFEKQKIAKIFAVSKGFVKGLIALFH